MLPELLELSHGIFQSGRFLPGGEEMRSVTVTGHLCQRRENRFVALFSRAVTAPRFLPTPLVTSAIAGECRSTGEAAATPSWLLVCLLSNAGLGVPCVVLSLKDTARCIDLALNRGPSFGDF